MIRRIVVAVTLVAAALFGFNPSRAEASECTIPGNGVATWTNYSPYTGITHRGCSRLLYQAVPGNPSICFESYWIQELTDIGSDSTWYTMSRATDYTGQWFSSPGQYDWNSFDWNPVAGWRTVPRHPTYGCSGGMFAYRMSFTNGTINGINITPVYG